MHNEWRLAIRWAYWGLLSQQARWSGWKTICGVMIGMIGIEMAFMIIPMIATEYSRHFW
jgi:hypothetical protein